MDDTAFHYSRTLRIIMILAIVIPILVIGLIIWYYTAVDVPHVPAGEHETAGTVAPSGTSSDVRLIIRDAAAVRKC